MNNNEMNNNELSKLISSFVRENGGKADDKNRKQVEKMVGNLNEKQAAQLSALLKDPKKSAEVLNSPAAQALWKKLGG